MPNTPGTQGASDHPLVGFKAHPLYPAVRDAIQFIRPMLQVDGGNIYIEDITDDGIVVVELSGSCTGCSAAKDSTLPGVERLLLERVPEVKGIRDVTTHDSVPVVVRPGIFRN